MSRERPQTDCHSLLFCPFTNTPTYSRKELHIQQLTLQKRVCEGPSTKEEREIDSSVFPPLFELAPVRRVPQCRGEKHNPVALVRNGDIFVCESVKILASKRLALGLSKRFVAHRSLAVDDQPAPVVACVRFVRGDPDVDVDTCRVNVQTNPLLPLSLSLSLCSLLKVVAVVGPDLQERTVDV